MLHTGIALELSKLIAEDRRADARARRRVRSALASSRVPPDTASDRSFERRERAGSARRRSDGAPTAPDDPWWAWRVVEPDARHLRRRAA